MRFRTSLVVLLLAALVPGLATIEPMAARSAAADAHPEASSAQRAVPGIVRTEVAFRRAWADPGRRRIELGADIVLRDCRIGEPIRESPYPLELDGNGHTIRQSCFEKRLLRQDGTGFLDCATSASRAAAPTARAPR